MQDASKLMVWQKALDLAQKVYSSTTGFPKHEVYGLASQMQRAAVSTGSNIAEGAGRNSKREFYQFIGISCGSASELLSQVELSFRMNYITPEIKDELKTEIDHNSSHEL